MKRQFLCLVGAALLAASASAHAGQVMSVQVRNGQLRASPSFLGKPVTEVAYADQVTVLTKQGDWTQVRTQAGATGWIHQSALSARKIVLKAGADDVATTASGKEIALAGKGFNSDVESDFRSKNKDVDFAWIDRMERFTVDPQEAIRFLDAGGVKAVE